MTNTNQHFQSKYRSLLLKMCCVEKFIIFLLNNNFKNSVVNLMQLANTYEIHIWESRHLITVTSYKDLFRLQATERAFFGGTSLNRNDFWEWDALRKNIWSVEYPDKPRLTFIVFWYREIRLGNDSQAKNEPCRLI